MANLNQDKKNQKSQKMEVKDPKDLFKSKKEKIEPKKEAEKVETKEADTEKNEGLIIEESNDLSLGERKEKKLVNKKKKPENVNLKNYQDMEGLTMRKLSLGLWIVEHRAFMLTLLYGFLIFIGVVTWGFFIYGFGGYLLFGMRNDNKLAQELVSGAQINKDVIFNQSPKDLDLGSVKIIKLPDKKFDFLIKITNPNAYHWAEFDYHFQSNGRTFGHANGFVLPNESKYLMVLGQELDFQPGAVSFHSDNLSWNRISRIEYEDWEQFQKDHFVFEIKDKEFISDSASELSEKTNFNVLNFNVKNNTAYSYWEARFIILLMSNNSIVGAEKIMVNNFMSGENRQVRVVWPGKLAKVSEIIITPEINITDKSVYIAPQGGVGELK